MTKQHHHDHQKTEETEVFEEASENQEEFQDEESIEDTVEEIDEVAAKTAELKEEVEKLRDMYMRSQAEMENLRKRTQIELEKRSKYAVSSFARDLLTVGDNLSRAIDAIPEEEKQGASELIKNLVIGLEMTQKELNAAFEKNDIKPVESIGHVFDPNVHKVVQEIEDPTKPAGTIIQEWQKGYIIGGDRTLREAVVIVTKGGPKAGEKPDEPGKRVDTSA